MPRRQSDQRKKTGLTGITQLGPDRFLVCVFIRDSKTGGRRKREGTAKSLTEAITLKEGFLADTVVAKRTRMRFADYGERWLKQRADRLAPSTRANYTNDVAHLIVGFGEIFVDSITPSDVREWQARFSKDHAPATVNSWHRRLRQVLEDAVVDEYLVRNPACLVKTLPEGRTKGKRGNALDVAEFRKLIQTTRSMMSDHPRLKPVGEAIAEDIGRMLLTLAWTGIRRGELLALKWTDEVEGELHIERAIWMNKEKTTKTDDPRRVTLTEPLRAVLAEQRAWLLKAQHPGLSSGLIFPARAPTRREEDGELVWFRSGSVLDKPLSLVVKKAGVRPISLHSFRRTYENLLRKAGVDQLVRQSIAGWRTDEAQAIYATVDRSERDQAAAAVTELVLGAPLLRPAATPEAKSENARKEPLS
jgi:integrase